MTDVGPLSQDKTLNSKPQTSLNPKPQDKPLDIAKLKGLEV